MATSHIKIQINMAKLTTNHPLDKKLREVENLCSELGITFSFSGYDIRVTDEGSGVECVYMSAEGEKANNLPDFDGTYLRLVE